MKSEFIRMQTVAPAVFAGDQAAGFSSPAEWWARYLFAVRDSGISPTAAEVLELDTQYLLDMGIASSGDDQADRWPAGRLRRGLVMGSVQSGKTASMLGVAAKAVDRGVDIVVILGGTRLALWRQTYARVLHHLDGWTCENDDQRRRERVLIPNPLLLRDESRIPGLADLYFHQPGIVRRMLAAGRPVIAVVMKQPDHLMQFAAYLTRLLAATLPALGRRIELLVIDDEADDGSILDREIELATDGELSNLKHIPRHIARIWAESGPPHETWHRQLFATYLAYTATPQANFLQSDHNPLAPSDFVAALRIPFEEGSIVPPRSATYKEPLGPTKFYTGGEVFYRRLSDGFGGLCVSLPFPERGSARDDEEHQEEVRLTQAALLSSALRSYFVAGALRLLAEGTTLSVCKTLRRPTASEVRDLVPRPHTMLIHPSARVLAHFEGAEGVVEWTREFLEDGCAARSSQLDNVNLDATGLAIRLEREEPQWREWLEAFAKTQERIAFNMGGVAADGTGQPTWERVKQCLRDEVFPNTRLAIINSDPRADDRPHFEPELQEDGSYGAPKDVFTIFVSGNVMARGVTLEGLTTTLFLRQADEPLADTQMQMQRWFGYRGGYLQWCRLFSYQDQIDLFRAFHEADEALRAQIIQSMNLGANDSHHRLVLRGERFRATGKVSNLRALPLCPGADPFVRIIEPCDSGTTNAGALSTLLNDDQWIPVVAAGRQRGIAMVRRLALLEVAEILESFRYSSHAPSVMAEVHTRWSAVAVQLGLISPLAPLFRPPTLGFFKDAVAAPACPYSIAAYLRLWSAMLTRRARGFFATDNSTMPWSMIDLAAYATSAPQFVVGIRFGSAGSSGDAALRAAGVQVMERDHDGCILRSTWGSRNPGDQADNYLGDQLFDYHVHSEAPPRSPPCEPLWRPRGSPGLLLFHVVKSNSGGESVTVGLGLPKGGPDHIAALRS